MRIVLILSCCLLLTACGTTRLVSYDSNVDIYVNNQFKGKGEAEITRTGPPQKSHIEARYQGSKVGETDIRRQVKFSTVFIGLYTYGVGFLFTWRYPEMVIIPIDMPQNTKKSFDKVPSIWDLPPGEWRR